MLTVNARVQEVLQFCVGSTAINDSTTTPGGDCSNISGTSVDLGVVDTTTTGAVSPDADGNSFNGIAMVTSNAAGNTTIGYKSVQDSGTNQKGALRVPAAACNATANFYTDQCFESFTTETVPVSNTEMFGMTVRFVNRGSSTGVPTTSLGTLNAAYDFSSSGYAWDTTGGLVNLATASGPTNDEALILKFSAVAAITTPTGSYQTQGDFIATPTY